VKAMRLLLVVLLVAYSLHQSPGAVAQANGEVPTLSGRVVIKASGTPAKGTRIWVYEAKGPKNFSVQQDRNGAFSISLPDGYYFVFVANLGLVPYAKEVSIEHGKPIKLIVKLEPDFEIMQDAPPAR
jgi:hypothetical protein